MLWNNKQYLKWWKFKCICSYIKKCHYAQFSFFHGLFSNSFRLKWMKIRKNRFVSVATLAIFAFWSELLFWTPFFKCAQSFPPILCKSKITEVCFSEPYSNVQMRYFISFPLTHTFSISLFFIGNYQIV